MDIVKTFSQNLKKYRAENHISQENLALLCGLHRTYISDVERCKRNITIENVQRIADALGVEAYKLFLDSENN